LKLRITLEELKRPTLQELMAENAKDEGQAPLYRTTSKFENPYRDARERRLKKS
jgi:hypothetical protein